MSGLTDRLRAVAVPGTLMYEAAARITELEASARTWKNESDRNAGLLLEARAQIAAALEILTREGIWLQREHMAIEALSSPVTHPEPEPTGPVAISQEQYQVIWNTGYAQGHLDAQADDPTDCGCGCVTGEDADRNECACDCHDPDSPKYRDLDAAPVVVPEFVDPEPWVTPSRRVAHPLPGTWYVSQPRTRAEFESDPGWADPFPWFRWCDSEIPDAPLWERYATQGNGTEFKPRRRRVFDEQKGAVRG